MTKSDSSHRSRVLALLREEGLLRPRELTDRGIPRSTLQRLLKAGEVERVARGLYALPGHLLSAHQSLLEVWHSAQGCEMATHFFTFLAVRELGF